MTRYGFWGAPLALLLAVAGASGAPLEWVDTYDQALSQARADGKLVLLVLDSELCPWCAKLEQETLQADVVTAQGERFVAVKVSVAKDRDLGTKFAKSGVPQTVFLSASGQQVGKVGGYVPATVLAAQMRDAWAVREAPTEIAELKQAIADRPRDAQALARLGQLYVATDQGQKAEPILKRAVEQAAELEDSVAAGARLDLLITRLPAHDGELAPEFTTWLEKNPQHDRLVEAQYYAGYALALKGDGQKALDLWAKVTSAAPKSTYGILAAHYTTAVREAMQRRGNGG